VENKGYKRS